MYNSNKIHHNINGIIIMPKSYFKRWFIIKAVNNLAWMLLGVAVGTGAMYCYNECSCDGKIKDTMEKVKKDATKKIENMMEK